MHIEPKQCKSTNGARARRWLGALLWVPLCSISLGCDGGGVIEPTEWPKAIGVDDKGVFWINELGAVRTCPLEGCAGDASTLVSTRPTAQKVVLAVDEKNAYYSTGSAVAACAVEGCFDRPTTREGVGTVLTLTAKDGSVYYESGCGETLSKWTPGTDPVVLASGSDDNCTAGIAVQGDNVYWSSRGRDNRILRCSVNGCGGFPDMFASAVARNLAADATNLYWATDDGLMSCALDGCAGKPTRLGPAASDAWIVSDGSRAWWTHGGDIVSCPIDGCDGAPTTVISGAADLDFAVDSTSIYWSDGTNVRKTPKPASNSR